MSAVMNPDAPEVYFRDTDEWHDAYMRAKRSIDPSELGDVVAEVGDQILNLLSKDSVPNRHALIGGAIQAAFLQHISNVADAEVITVKEEFRKTPADAVRMYLLQQSVNK